MEKMQAIYTQNPKLGDPNAIAQSLEHNSVKIGEIQAELDKFKVLSLTPSSFPSPSLPFPLPSSLSPLLSFFLSSSSSSPSLSFL